MKVLFITNTARYNFAEPLGMMILSQLAREHGHETKFAPDIYRDAREMLETFKPDIVATTCTTGEHVEQIRLNRELKKVRPFFSLMGGPHATFFPQMIREEGIDAVCRGEGEGATLDLLNAMERGEDLTKIENLFVKDEHGEIHETPLRPLIKDLDSTPFADRQTYYALHNRASLHRVPHLIASRGCVFNCTYCFNRKYFEDYKGLGSRFRYRSPENVVEECARVVAEWGADALCFVDDIFPVKSAWLNEFRQLYQARVGLPWTCYTRIELIKPEVCKMLKDAGCLSVYIGLESGNETLRKTILDRHMTNDDIRVKTQMLHDAGIRFATNNIIGFPQDSVKAGLETLKLNRQIKPALASSFFFQPYPGTEAGEIAKRLGMYDGSLDGCGNTIVDVGKNYHIKDQEKLSRLRALMGPAVGIPGVAPLVPLLIRLPLDHLYNWLSKMWVGYCYWMRLYPRRLNPVRFARQAVSFLTANGGPY